MDSCEFYRYGGVFSSKTPLSIECKLIELLVAAVVVFTATAFSRVLTKISGTIYRVISMLWIEGLERLNWVLSFANFLFN